MTCAGIDGRALRGRSVIRKSCWDRWWLMLPSMPCAAVDVLNCGRWPVLWRRLVEVLAGVLAASWVAVGVLVV